MAEINESTIIIATLDAASSENVTIEPIAEIQTAVGNLIEHFIFSFEKIGIQGSARQARCMRPAAAFTFDRS